MSCKPCDKGFLIVGTILAILGLLVIFLIPGLIEQQVNSNLHLGKSGPVFTQWLNIPIPIYMHVYLYNCTNAAEVQNNTTNWTKPNFERIGPYVFREIRLKENLTWDEDDNLVSYKTRSYYYFEESRTNGTLNDSITAVHLPSIAAAETARKKPKFIKKIINSALNSNGGALFQTHSAGEWLFQGFYDQFLDFVLNMNNIMPTPITSNRFAWFLDRNGSSDFAGTFNVYTGLKNLQNRGVLKTWNNLSHTGFFEGNCGNVNGSSPDLFMPHIEKDQIITLFTPEACRGINLYPVADLKIQGVNGIRYEAPEGTFDNGQLNPDMSCYCPKELQPDNCPKTGATAIGSCQHDAPAFLSHPGFMYADPSYTAGITGLKVNKTKDTFFMVLEPKLGTPLEVNAAIQINIRVQPDKEITIIEKVEEFYAPMMVINTKALITEELASKVKFVNNLTSYISITGIVLTVFGLLVIVFVTYKLISRK